MVARQLRVNRGAVVQAVAPNSAAARAGLLPTRRALSGIVAGDVIVALNKRPISKPGARPSHGCRSVTPQTDLACWPAV